jgi:hypothetical protein
MDPNIIFKKKATDLDLHDIGYLDLDPRLSEKLDPDRI